MKPLTDPNRELYRMIVIAASKESPLIEDALRRDQIGFWEEQAKDLWERATPRRLELGMSDVKACETLAFHLALLALDGLAQFAQNQSRSALK